MPTIFEQDGYKFRFYSNENDEPPHVHIMKGDGNAKYWLTPKVLEAYSYAFTVRERRDIKKIVRENQKTFITTWNEFFN